MKLNLHKPLSKFLKLAVIFSILNLVLPFDIIEEDSITDTRHHLSVSATPFDLNACDDALTLAMHARGHHRTRRLKRGLTAVLSTEIVLSNNQIITFLLSSNAKSDLHKTEFLLKHHRGPPKA